MTNKTKIALVAAIAATLVTPAAAQGLVPYYNYPADTRSYATQVPFHAERTQRLFEGRNAATSRDYTPSLRAPIVPDRATVLGN
jgi:hypothetical protein